MLSPFLISSAMSFFKNSWRANISHALNWITSLPLMSCLIFLPLGWPDFPPLKSATESDDHQPPPHIPRMWESGSSPEWGPEADIPITERLILPEEFNCWCEWHFPSTQPSSDPTEHDCHPPLESAAHSDDHGPPPHMMRMWESGSSPE